MHLFIDGLKGKQFNAEKILFKEGQILVDSSELLSYVLLMEDELTKARAVIANIPDDNAEPVFEIVEAESLLYTIDQFKASGWTEQQLLDAGHLIKREVLVANETAPTPPAAAAPTPVPPPALTKVIVEGQFEIGAKLYMMTAKAAGASYESFQGSGWKIEGLLSEGYATQIGGEKEAPQEAKTFPFLNSAGDWEDSAGTVWDAAAHSMGANKIPPVTTKGLFKKTRSRTKTPVAPEADSTPVAPGVSEVNSIPAAPVAATIDNASGDVIEDEPLDDELANIVKDWG